MAYAVPPLIIAITATLVGQPRERVRVLREQLCRYDLLKEPIQKHQSSR